VQAATGIGRQADHIASVGWDFRMNQNDMQHVRIVARPARCCTIV